MILCETCALNFGFLLILGKGRAVAGRSVLTLLGELSASLTNDIFGSIFEELALLIHHALASRSMRTRCDWIVALAAAC